MLSVVLNEWESIKPVGDSPLYGIFLEDKRHLALAAGLAKDEILSLTEMRHGIQVQAYSYVGKIQFGQLQITIQPKIARKTLITLLQYAYRLRNLKFFDETHYSTETSLFFDLLIHQLTVEADEIIGRGLRREYLRSDESLASPRGKLNIQAIVRQGGIVQESIPCTYYPRNENSLVNQVLLAGLLLAARLTDVPTLRTRLRRLARLLQDSVSTIQLNLNVMDRVHSKINRLNAAYEPAITLIEILVAGEGISLDQGESSVGVPGFLFDMNRFFEKLISRFLSENLRDYTVQPQYIIREMMSYTKGFNPQKRRSPAPRPDLVITQGTKIITMLDTKYRDLWNKSLPREMLYQLAVYALSQGFGGKAVILYPSVEVAATESRIEIRKPVVSGQQAQVVLRPVDLVFLENLISGTDTRELSSFANYLVFG